jgi:phosphatidylglycerol lysyltransferase
MTLFRSAWAKSSRLTVCFLPIPENSLAMYQMSEFEHLHIGSSAVINVRHFLKETVKDKWWRWKQNRATKAGYEYQVSQPPHSGALLQQCLQVSDEWLEIGGHTERGFALGYFDESYLNSCRLHYLTDPSGKIVAFTNQLPVYGKQNTATVDLLRYSSEARDAMPYLLAKTIEQISCHQPEFHFFDLGFVPFAGVRGPLRVVAQTLSAGRFSARGLQQFKSKFDPEWQPYYLAYDGDLTDLAAIALNLETVMRPG